MKTHTWILTLRSQRGMKFLGSREYRCRETNRRKLFLREFSGQNYLFILPIYPTYIFPHCASDPSTLPANLKFIFFKLSPPIHLPSPSSFLLPSPLAFPHTCCPSCEPPLPPASCSVTSQIISKRCEEVHPEGRWWRTHT